MILAEGDSRIFFGSTGIGSALKGDYLAFSHIGQQRFKRVDDEAEIRFTMIIQGGTQRISASASAVCVKPVVASKPCSTAPCITATGICSM